MVTKRILLCLLLLAAKYKAQELPAYYVPNFTPNVTHRTSFCDIHAAVERGELELRNALQGLAITIGFTAYQLNQETGGIDEENPNVVFEMADELAKRAGFSYRDSYGKVDDPKPHESWSDVLYYATDVYDVAGDWWTESTSRLANNIIYPDAWYDASFVMVEQTGRGAKFDFFSFASPFTPGLWGLIAITTIVSGLVYYVLDYIDSRIMGRRMDMGLEASLFFTAYLMQGHMVHQPKSRGTRVLFFSMAFFFFLAIACYTANLANYLVMKNRQVVINDIQDVIGNDLTFCVERNSLLDDHLRSFRIEPRHIVRTDSEGEQVEFDGALFVALQEEKCDIVYIGRATFDKAKMRKEYNPDCNLDLVGRTQKFQYAGFALKHSQQYCASVVRDVLHLHMLEMKQEGMYDLIWENALKRAASDACGVNTDSGDNQEMQDNLSLGIANVRGMFTLYAIALASALLATLLSFCRQPSSRRKRILSDLKSSISGKGTLNRAAFAAKDRSGAFSFGKNDQTGAIVSAGMVAMSNDDFIPRPTEKDMESTNDNVDSDERKEVSKKKVSCLHEKNEEGKTILDVLTEQNQEKKVLIELLLQQIEKMDERDLIIDERDRRISERDEKIDKRYQAMEVRLQKIEDKMT